MKKIMKKLIKKIAILTLVTGAFISCNNDEDDTTANTQGDVKVSVTDDPFPFDFATEANISIAKVELKDAAGNYTTVFEGNGDYNMVGLTNGVTAQVNNTSLEAGTYSEAKVTLSDASVHLSNGTEFSLTADASQSYTVAIEPALVVEQGEQSELLLDLNIGNSFQFEGMGGIALPDWISNIDSIQGCSFTADFSAVDLDQTGAVSGTISNTSGTTEANALVTIYSTNNTEEIASTQTDANGSFTFIGIAEGTYTVSAETSGSLDGHFTGAVTVATDGTFTCNFTVQ